MSRDTLLNYLNRYEKIWLGGASCSTLNRMRAFVEGNPDCCERSLQVGHMTGSALIVNSQFDRVLLTHHRKIGKWLQLGGHADGDTDIFRVAMREAQEESGLNSLRYLGNSEAPAPFDIDIHAIPAHGETPSHEHFDMRFVLVADDAEPLVQSEESSDLRWFSLSEAFALTDEPSMHRQFDKIQDKRLDLSIQLSNQESL